MDYIGVYPNVFHYINCVLVTEKCFLPHIIYSVVSAPQQSGYHEAKASLRCLCATGSSQEVEHVKTKWSLRSHSHSLEKTVFVILYIFIYLCSPPKWRGCNMSNQWVVTVWQTPWHVNINSSLTFSWLSLLSPFISLISLPIFVLGIVVLIKWADVSCVWQMVVGPGWFTTCDELLIPPYLQAKSLCGCNVIFSVVMHPDLTQVIPSFLFYTLLWSKYV